MAPPPIDITGPDRNYLLLDSQLTIDALLNFFK
jgi:hypothetical protein